MSWSVCGLPGCAPQQLGACTGDASVKVADPEAAAAVDVEMKDTGSVEAVPKGQDRKQGEPSGETAPAKDKQAADASNASVDKGKAKEGDKHEEDKKEVKEKVVDEDLLRAFRYFDKTGEPME